jgi:hypothetical protein
MVPDRPIPRIMSFIITNSVIHATMKFPAEPSDEEPVGEGTVIAVPL